MAVCFTLTTIFVCVRLLTKYCVDRVLQWEDCQYFWNKQVELQQARKKADFGFSGCCLVAWIGILAFGGVILDAQSQGAGRHQWDVNVINAVKVAKTSNIGSIIYGPIIAIAKLAILLQYKRIFVAHKRNFVFYGVHVLIWTNLVFYIIETFLEIFACTPRERIWNPMVPGHCIGVENNYIAVGVWNVISDFSILILPMVAIWNLQMQNARKIGVAAVFATGLFACVASVVRLAYTVDLLYTKDGTYSIIKVGLWNVGELTTIILCATFPIVPKFLHWTTGKTKRSTSYNHPRQSAGYPAGSKRSNNKNNHSTSSHPMVSTPNPHTHTHNPSTPWPEDISDHDINLIGRTPKGIRSLYHNLDVGTSHYGSKAASISTVEPVARRGEAQMVLGNGNGNGIGNEGIWTTNEVRVDTSLSEQGLEMGRHDFV
ncbi:hypothetical protein BDR22DRAFT_124439 [Usnea florida]